MSSFENADRRREADVIAHPYGSPASYCDDERTDSLGERLRDLLSRDATFHFTPELDNDDSLFETGVLDSFGMIALVIQIEEEFGIKVIPEEATVEHFRSVSSIVAYVETKLDGTKFNGNHRR